MAVKSFLLVFFSLFVFLCAKADWQVQDFDKEIILNNRILAKVNGKAISALDIMKRMDFLFYQLFPKLVDSTVSRYQFYQNNWKDVLKETIDRELIVADALEKKLTVSDGDVREEMEDLFGPNVISNIDSLGLTYEDVWQMIHTNITVRRMLLHKVNSKAMIEINPNSIQNAYKTFSKKNTTPCSWNYQVITIRGSDPEQTKKLSETSYEFLQKEKCSFLALPEKMREINGSDLVNISVSEEYKHTEKTISSDHKSILSSLSPNSYSKPVTQISRTMNAPVYRIFHLKEYHKEKIPNFSEVEEQIKTELFESSVAKGTEEYVEKLRAYYGINEEIFSESNFKKIQPFALLSQ